ncbi:hypothetical protein CL634_10480, partial [bacterium]|nr:hypothetical protein [bacterium]
EKLNTRFISKKTEVLNHLGSTVIDDPEQARFWRDDPHFTMMCGRTNDYEGLRDGLTTMRARFPAVLEYALVGMKDEPKDGLIEIHSVMSPEDIQQVVDLHYAIVEAGLPFNADSHCDLFDQTNLEGYAHANLQYCGFPAARGLFKAHASLGRVNEELRECIDYLVEPAVFDPAGLYRSPGLILGRLPTKEDDPTFTPFALEPIEVKKC